MTDLWIIASKAFWCGWAALGFGILFNTPNRALISVWLGGFLAGLVKFALLGGGANIVASTFMASLAVGIVGIPIAHWRHVTPTIFCIPSVIPLVPGVYAYRTMLGLMKLTWPIDENYSGILTEAVRSSVITLFVVMAIAIGVIAPMMALGQESVKNISLKNIGKRKAGNN